MGRRAQVEEPRLSAIATFQVSTIATEAVEKRSALDITLRGVSMAREAFEYLYARPKGCC